MMKKMIRCLAAVAMAGACANGAWAGKSGHTCHGRVFETSIGDSAALANLCTNGGSGYLTADIVLEETLSVASDKEVSLCLNGYRLLTGSNHGIKTQGDVFVTSCCRDERTVRYWNGDTRLTNVADAAAADYVTTGGVCSAVILVGPDDEPASFDFDDLPHVRCEDVNFIGSASDGMSVYFASVTVTNCLFAGNASSGLTLARMVRGTIADSVFEHHRVSGYSGIMAYQCDAALEIDRCVSRDNAIGLWSETLEEYEEHVGKNRITLRDSLIADNIKCGYYGVGSWSCELVLDGTVSITNNPNNVLFFLGDENHIICTADGFSSDSLVGITIYDAPGTGVFGAANDVDRSSCFFSDNPAYEVVYNADKMLEVGERVVPEYAASVTINGVTTFYATLLDAWAYATNNQNMVDVSVKLLKDAALGGPLVRTVDGVAGWTVTLDLNDCVLAYGGEDDTCFIRQAGGNAMHIIDTATTRTPRFFTRDKGTGLWTLSNAETDLTVSGGLITGGRAGAVSFTYGSGMISNVNFVGNHSVSDGGAVSAGSGSLTIFNSTFLGNVTDGNGGAILASMPCELNDCRVESNVAGKQGGGVCAKIHASLVRTKVVGNRAGTDGGGVYLTLNAGPCFPAGVKILMADGSEKNVENIARGDVVATFDHEGGTNSSAAVFYVYRGTEAAHVFTLSFASGATLAIAGHHDLLLENTRKYVTVSSDDAHLYLGKRFYNYATGDWDELTGVKQAKDCDTHYSIYTRGHGNCVANGLLTVPDDTDCYINVYELGEDLKADAAQLAADIAIYGLAEPADYPNVPLDDFADGNVRYAFIAIGKGLTTQEEILFWNEYDYGPIVTEKVASVPKLTMTGGTPKSTAATPIAKPSDPYLQVGEDTVVTGNVTTVGAVSNVHLDRGKKAVIDILPDATGIDVGVTLSTGADIFGWTNAVNHAESFFSDNPAYSVSHTADGELALRAGIQVGGDAWAAVGADGVCTISGTGAMWNHGEWTAGNPLASQRLAIKSVVISNGVTSVGSQSFHKFYEITNVNCAASVTEVGDHAFYRCASLEALSFAGTDAPTFGTNAYTLHAGISIKDGMPDVFAIPEITISGYTRNLYGRVSLSEGNWEKITTTEQKRACRFSKVVLEK